jgi:hypothetical protein
MIRASMLSRLGGRLGHNHKAHAVIGRHGLEESLQRLDTTRRGTQADDKTIGHHTALPCVLLLFTIRGRSIVGYKKLM